MVCQNAYLCYDESMTIRIFWADSRGKVILVLVLLWLAALVFDFQLSALLFPLLAIVGSFVFDALLSRIRYGVWFTSLSSVITGLLIGLIVDPTSFTTLLVAVVLASVGKYFVGIGRQKHICNPAAFGIVLSSALFNRPVAWWGAAWGIVPLLIILFGMLLPLRQLRRLWMPVSFLFVYGVGLALLSSAESALKLTFDATPFLFAWVMLTEPIALPSRGLWRYGWGALVGALVIGFHVVGISWSDPLLTALLLANIVGFFLKRIV